MTRHRYPFTVQDAMEAERALSNALAWLDEAKRKLDDRIGVPAHEREMISRESFYLGHILDRVRNRYAPKATQEAER